MTDNLPRANEGERWQDAQNVAFHERLTHLEKHMGAVLHRLDMPTPTPKKVAAGRSSADEALEILHNIGSMANVGAGVAMNSLGLFSASAFNEISDIVERELRRNGIPRPEPTTYRPTPVPEWAAKAVRQALEPEPPYAYVLPWEYTKAMAKLVALREIFTSTGSYSNYQIVNEIIERLEMVKPPGPQGEVLWEGEAVVENKSLGYDVLPGAMLSGLHPEHIGKKVYIIVTRQESE